MLLLFGIGLVAGSMSLGDLRDDVPEWRFVVLLCCLWCVALAAGALAVLRERRVQLNRRREPPPTSRGS